MHLLGVFEQDLYQSWECHGDKLPIQYVEIIHRSFTDIVTAGENMLIRSGCVDHSRVVEANLRVRRTLSRAPEDDRIALNKSFVVVPSLTVGV